MLKKKKKVNNWMPGLLDQETIGVLRRLREEKYMRLNGVLLAFAKRGAATEQDE